MDARERRLGGGRRPRLTVTSRYGAASEETERQLIDLLLRIIKDHDREGREE
jgi:hypothetical protein